MCGWKQFKLRFIVLSQQQDDQPDIQGLAVTLIGGRSTTESAIGAFTCTFNVVRWFLFTRTTCGIV